MFYVVVQRDAVGMPWVFVYGNSIAVRAQKYAPIGKLSVVITCPNSRTATVNKAVKLHNELCNN